MYSRICSSVLLLRPATKRNKSSPSHLPIVILHPLEVIDELVEPSVVSSILPQTCSRWKRYVAIVGVCGGRTIVCSNSRTNTAIVNLKISSRARNLRHAGRKINTGSFDCDKSSLCYFLFPRESRNTLMNGRVPSNGCRLHR